VATTRTKNLRLIVSDNLSSDAKANLYAIDRFAELLLKLNEHNIFVGNSSQEIVEVDTESVGDVEASDVSGLTLKNIRDNQFEFNNAASTFQIKADRKGRITEISAKPIAISATQITDFLQAVDNITGVDIESGAPNYTPQSKGAIVLDNSVNPPVLYVSKDKTAPSDWLAFRPAPTAVKKKFVVSAQDIINGYLTLTTGQVIPNSVVAFLDRIPLFEGVDEDYSVTYMPNGDVRLVFGPNLLDENLANEIFRITYWTP
jgi:hypothetical protein